MVGESSSGRARMSTSSTRFESEADAAAMAAFSARLDEAVEMATDGSSSQRRLSRSRTTGGVPRRRGRPRRKVQLGGADEVLEEEIAAWVADAEAEEVEGRHAYPHDPRLSEDFARGWDPSQLVLAPERHLSQRLMRGWRIGQLRTFSGFSSVFWAYGHALSPRSREFQQRCAFAPLIRAWADIHARKARANHQLLRAFLDRFRDTTSTFHMLGYEAGLTLSGFAVMTGLPCGSTALDFDRQLVTLDSPSVVHAIGGGLIEKRNEGKTALVATSYILDYFQDEGRFLPSEGDEEKNARLCLWWFLLVLHFGEKGERATTQLLPYLMDWGGMGTFDWVTPALGLTIKYFRDAVRPDVMERGSKPSLVFPGFIMEVRIYACKSLS
ncbi:hypothetical protein RND81_11G067400 [Saponaria officinalis]|uniref:Aminotransferase-like plant mobile domain-containing protein n=1 Tax=Saponaria officinalis TaxID=3572 RepID=A0AAW1HIU1_SAPOF